MERGPEFIVVGNAPEEEKEKAIERVEKNLFQHLESLPETSLEILKEHEVPKTRGERLLINFANAETNRLLLYYGLQPYAIPEENYHLLPHDTYHKEFNEDQHSTGAASFFRQGIAIDAGYSRKNPIKFGEISMHETLHLKRKPF